MGVLNPAAAGGVDLAAYRDIHHGRRIVVCGCGESLNLLTEPSRFLTIGVNDVGRLFHPDYLVVVDPPGQFKADRFRYVQTSQAGALFTQRTDLGVAHPNIVRFRLGEKDGTDFSNPDVLPYSVTTPYVALGLAIHLGAADIGVIGVDFSDRHFFGDIGRHDWAPHVATIDTQFDRLARAALARGVRIFNLSPTSRLTALPPMSIDTFAALDERGASPAPPGKALRIVSYSTTPLVGVPSVLARCINAGTRHLARAVWATGTYDTGMSFEGDVSWAANPARSVAEIEAADIVIVHNGKVDDRHRSIIATKPVITMAHNYMSNVDDRLVRAGFPALVVGQYQATLPEFAGWSVVPNPVPTWEPRYCPAAKNTEVTIAYTPPGRHQVYPRDHPLYWHGKGHDATLRVLDRLAARYPIRLEVLRGGGVSHAQAMDMKRRAHIVIDECVTGSYHRNSLEGLAVGCVVVNHVGHLPGVVDALRGMAADATAPPFVGSSLHALEATLERLIAQGPERLSTHGLAGREWLLRHWNFADQWTRFWQPAIDAALRTAAQRTPRSARVRPASAATPPPGISVVVVCRNEGPLLRRTVECLDRTLPHDGEIIVVDDGSTDGSTAFLADDATTATGARTRVIRPLDRCGVAGARNLGAAHARGRIVVFSDGHMAMPPGWAAPLADALDDPDVGAAAPGMRVMRHPDDFERDLARKDDDARGYGCRWSGDDLGIAWLRRKSDRPFPAPLLGGAFMAMRRNVFAAIGGFDGGMDIWGSEDAEISLRLWLLGYRCMVVPAVEVSHFFRSGDRPYRVPWEAVLYNKLRLAHLHFSEPRRQRVSGRLVHNPAFPAAVQRLELSDAEDYRSRLHALRRHDDDWFFATFSDETMPGLSDLQGLGG